MLKSKITHALVFSGMAWMMASPAHAQGYAGALLSLSNVADGCVLADKCDKRSVAAKVYFGSRLREEDKLKLGPVSLSAVEVSYIRGGTARSSQVLPVERVDEANGGTVFEDAQFKSRVRASALTLAGVVELPIASGVTASAKAGIAYVSATANAQIDGDSYGSKSTNRISPYLGLGIQVAVTPSIRLVGGLDAFRYKADTVVPFVQQVDRLGQLQDLASYRKTSQSGFVTQFGIGAEASF